MQYVSEHVLHVDQSRYIAVGIRQTTSVGQTTAAGESAPCWTCQRYQVSSLHPVNETELSKTRDASDCLQETLALHITAVPGEHRVAPPFT